MSPSTTSTTEVPRMALLFTFPVKEQASRMTTPTKININPKSVSYTHLDVYKRQEYNLNSSLRLISGKFRLNQVNALGVLIREC